MLRYRVHERGRESGSNTSRPSDLSGNFRRIRTHGARWTGSDSIRINDAPAHGRVSSTPLRSITSRPISGRMLFARNRKTPSPSWSIMSATISSNDSGEQIAEDIKPLEIQRGLNPLTKQRLAWTTIAKMRGIMRRIYKVGILHEHVAKNPVVHVETRCKSNYRAIVITPAQTLTILKSLPSLFITRWCSPVRRRHSARRRFSRCAGRTSCGSKEGSGFRSAGPREKMEKPRRRRRTATSLASGLGGHLRAWHSQTPHAKEADFVFPSFRPRRMEAALLFRICRRPSAAGRKESRSADRRMAKGSDFTTFVTRSATGL